ncbi:MAG: efflux RND transporter periplasmic adaptor subunit [Sneathiella sp.]|nr:efflux RND transporter periplasmic adaptor subunit [Sneathiella sp.]
MTLVFKIILPVIILIAGIGSYSYFVSTKAVETPEPVKERVWNVAAQTLEPGTLAPTVQIFGTLIPARDVDLRSLVAGEVIRVSPNFKEGALLETGEMLIEIDPFDAQAILAEKKATTLEAQSRLVELRATEKSDRVALIRDEEILAVDVRNLKRSEKLSKKGNISERALDDARSALSRQHQQVEQRTAQLEIQRARIGQQKAVLERLKVGVKRAERDLKNTRLTAPFSGYISELGADLGKRVDAKDKVARLIDASQLEVKFHLSDRQYGVLLASEGGVINRPVSVRWMTGDKEHVFKGTIARIGSEIKAETGGIDIYAILDAESLIAEVRSGAFVEVMLTGQSYSNAVRVPEYSVYERNKVYVVENGRLVARTIQVLFDNGSNLLITGDLKAGDQLVTTRFAEIGPSLRVEIR